MKWIMSVTQLSLNLQIPVIAKTWFATDHQASLGDLTCSQVFGKGEVWLVTLRQNFSTTSAPSHYAGGK